MMAVRFVDSQPAFRVRFTIITTAVLVLGISLFAAAPALGADKLLINIASREPVTNEHNTGFLNRIVEETFRRMGREAEVIYYRSSARGLKNANSGIDDGVGLRVMGLEKKFPNLIRVPEHIIINDFVAFSTRHKVKTNDWHSLDNHSIAHILGWQIFRNNLKHHTHTKHVQGNDQLFDLLVNDRSDFILHERSQGTWHAQQRKLDFSISEPPLAKRKMFMYLHKKNAALVGPAAAALAAMKADGTYKKIVEETLSIYLPHG